MINNQIFFFFYNLAHQTSIFDNIVIFFAVYFVYILILLAFLFLIFFHKIFPSEDPLREFLNKWKEFILLFLSGGSAWVLAKILKILIHTLRPFEIFSQVQPLFSETGYAFPSGHTAVAFAVAFAIFFTNKKAGYVFMFCALLVGLSRITGGVHFPIDILGGFFLGSGVVLLVKYLLKKFAFFTENI